MRRQILHSFIAALCFVVATAQAHIFEEQDLLGGTKQVRLEPKYSGSNLIGLEVYELWPDEQVGHAFLSKKSYYRFDTQRVTEDRDWYYVNGLLGEGSLEVENRYETQHWSSTPELAATLDKAAKLVANPKTSIEELKAMYRSLVTVAFKVKAGPIEREGSRQFKWLAGLQKIDQLEITVAKAAKYGNRFTARFAN